MLKGKLPVRIGNCFQLFFRVFTFSFFNPKIFFMGNILYVLAVILIIAWLLGYFAFNVTSGLIHILLVIAVIVFLLKLIGGRRSI